MRRRRSWPPAASRRWRGPTSVTPAAVTRSIVPGKWCRSGRSCAKVSVASVSPASTPRAWRATWRAPSAADIASRSRSGDPTDERPLIGGRYVRGMRACTVAPGRPDTAGVEDIREPASESGEVLVEGLLVGVCGTDVEITSTGYGWPPPGHERIVLFHESLGRVLEAPADSGLVAGDLVVGIVRRPDPVPCLPCSKDQWDFCSNGRYTVRGIKEIDGFGAERWRAPAKYVVKLDKSVGALGVLTEPTSVVAKAWDYSLRLGARAPWQPKTVLVTGAGPIGLLAAMIGVQKGLDVHVLDRVTDGPKPKLVADLGATYHAG